MISANNISIGYDGNVVISNASFSLRKGEKVALVGPNGSGKTTLLKTLRGMIKPDSGTIVIGKDSKMAYLPQVIEIDSEEIVIDYIKRVSGIRKIEEESRNLADKLENSESLLAYGRLQEEYAALDGYSFESKALLILRGFGFDGNEIANRKISSLSGGQKSKIAIASLILSKPDFLLLDEPTNNLDLPSIIWLETFLAETGAGCLIVSHDRDFLDRMVSKTLAVDPDSKKVSEHSGSYSQYIASEEKSRNRQKELYEIQQREIGQLQEAARKKKQWAAKGSGQRTKDNDKYLRGYRRDRSSRLSKGAAAIEKKIAAMDVIEKPVEKDGLSIPLDPKNDKARHAIRISELVAANGGFRIGPVTAYLDFGSRTAIIGSNGSGKTTLLNAIVGKTAPSRGTVSIGPSLSVGSIEQDPESLPIESTVIDFLLERTGAEKHLVYNAFHKFGFPANEVDRTIRSLSPGEKMRLVIAMHSLNAVNVLALDEPTNHLDIQALSALEELVEEYEGTMIMISHDRYFLEIFRPDRILLTENGKATEINDYSGYLSDCRNKSLKLLRELPSDL